MSDSIRSTVTGLLQRFPMGSSNSQDLYDQLFELLYDDLHAVAAGLMRRERPGHSLRPTALVNEAYLRLVDSSQIGFKERVHFLAVAAKVMRHVLVDHARRRSADRRGGHMDRVSFAEVEKLARMPEIRLLDLDRLLQQLEENDPRMAQIAELKIFGELTLDEISEVVDVSRRTVAEDWTVAKRWLTREYVRLDLA